jgi:hypothetical protein
LQHKFPTFDVTYKQVTWPWKQDKSEPEDILAEGKTLPNDLLGCTLHSDVPC